MEANDSNSMAMEDVEQVFSQYDTNGDGKITVPELRTVVYALDPDVSTDEVLVMIEEMDSNHDGFVDLMEFSKFCRAGDDQALRDAFELYDMDHNGLISAGELQLVLNKLGNKCSVEDCNRMIESVDADGSEGVNFEEFKGMMAAGVKGGGGASPPPTPSVESSLINESAPHCLTPSIDRNAHMM